MDRIGTMVLLVTLCACTLGELPLDEEGALAWFAERIEDEMLHGEYNGLNCINVTEDAARRFQIDGKYVRERHPEDAEELLTAARRCVWHHGHSFDSYARLARSFGEAALADTEARREVRRLFGSTHDLYPAVYVDEIVEEFTLDDLHDRAIAFGQERVRWYAGVLTPPISPCAVEDVEEFLTRHPLPECVQ